MQTDLDLIRTAIDAGDGWVDGMLRRMMFQITTATEMQPNLDTCDRRKNREWLDLTKAGALAYACQRLREWFKKQGYHVTAYAILFEDDILAHRIEVGTWGVMGVTRLAESTRPTELSALVAAYKAMEASDADR